MRNILLIMGRMANAQGLMLRLRENREFRLIYEAEYELAREAIRRNKAQIALIEVSESGKHGMSYCLDLCAELRCTEPGCRLLLMCPEQSRSDVERAVEAKREGKIDDFIFYDASVDYIASKLSSL